MQEKSSNKAHVVSSRTSYPDLSNIGSCFFLHLQSRTDANFIVATNATPNRKNYD